MKIALLNLPLDANYGGNLQRYALVTAIKNLDNTIQIEHINLDTVYKQGGIRRCLSYCKRMINKIIGKYPYPINFERFYQNSLEKKLLNIRPFYQKYVPYTPVIKKRTDLNKLTCYDAVIVGSDQVWRKTMVQAFGIDAYFLSFIRNCRCRRLAYAVSFGTDKNELSRKDIKRLGHLYSLFDAVSVREKSALSLLQQYQWNTPKAIHLLDPAFLLSLNDYIDLMNRAKTVEPSGNMFCYILDMDSNKRTKIEQLASQKQLIPFHIDIHAEYVESIEQWLRSFYEAEFIVTDSFHGLVFSIIFNKPFYLFYNSQRGNTRFDSLLSVFSLTIDQTDYNWKQIDETIQYYRELGIKFLQKNLLDLQ